MAKDDKDNDAAPNTVIDYYARERSVADSHAAERSERDVHARKAAMRRAWRLGPFWAICAGILAALLYLAYRLLTVGR
jgi:hypothetical protein